MKTDDGQFKVPFQFVDEKRSSPFGIFLAVLTPKNEVMIPEGLTDLEKEIERLRQISAM